MWCHKLLCCLDIFQEHLGVCGKFPVQCPNNCGLRDTQREKVF